MTKPITIKIEDQIIGRGHPVFVIAEAGVNHNGRKDLAFKLVDEAAKAGADAVKFQTFTTELAVTADAPTPEYQKKAARHESQFAMLKRLELPRNAYPALYDYCRKKGLIFLSTPFSEPDADFLEKLGVAAFKIASADLTNFPLLEYVSRKKKPMIVSTGMGTLSEVERAVRIVFDGGNHKLAILHCTAAYPPEYESLNLRAISAMAEALGGDVLIGYSDNGSPGYLAEVAAVSLGAVIIEKHFTLDKKLSGPDHSASLNPHELKTMVRAIRDTEKILGSKRKFCSAEEEPIRLLARRSIVSRKDIPKDHTVSTGDFIMKRPGTGLSPAVLLELLGKRAKKNIPQDSIIRRSFFD